jgi:hypothetical protein
LICVSNLAIYNSFQILSSSTAGLVAKKAEGREQLIVFDFTLWDLEHAASDGCSFCKWILEANDKERLRDNLVCKLASLEDGVTRNECYDTLPWSSDDSDEGTPSSTNNNDSLILTYFRPLQPP